MKGLLSFLTGAADQLDFIPGFDPRKDQQGMISKLMSGGQKPAGQSYQPQLDALLSQAGPTFERARQAAAGPAPINAVQKRTAQGMPPARINPPNPADFKTSYNILDVFNPFKNTNKIDLDDQHRYQTAVENYTAQQAQMASQAQTTQRGKDADTYGLTGRDKLSYIASGEVPDWTITKPNDSIVTGMGDFKQAPAAPEGLPTYSNELTEVIGPDGKPMLVRLDDQGGVTPVDGFRPIPPSMNNDPSRVHSTFVDSNGVRRLVMSSGEVQDTGIQNQNLGTISDIAGVPTLVDRTVRPNRAPVSTALSSIDEVANNKAVVTDATETAKSKVAQNAEDRQARVTFARQARVQLPKVQAALAAARKAKEISNAGNTGMIKIPYTGNEALKSQLATLEANLAFGELGDMRRTSPTGAGVGNVSEGELALLGSTVTNLNQDQSEGRLDENLDTAIAYLERLAAGLEEDASFTLEGSALTPELQQIDDELAAINAALGIGGAQ